MRALASPGAESRGGARDEIAGYCPYCLATAGGHAGQALDTVSATELLAEILRPILHNYRASARSTCITVRLSTSDALTRYLIAPVDASAHYLIALVDALFGPCRRRTPAPVPAAGS